MKTRKMRGELFNIVAGILEEQLESTESYHDYRSLLSTTLQRNQELTVEAAVNAVVADAMELAFILGWQAAKDPSRFLFQEDEK